MWMATKDQCQEHGEAIAVITEKVHSLKERVDEMEKVLAGIVRTFNSVGGAWMVIAIIAAFLSTVAANVVSARLLGTPVSVQSTK
jgi:hypothetical protein